MSKSIQKAPQLNNNQKTTKVITDALKKLSTHLNKSNIANPFKANQKTLLNTIATFLASFDNTFEESSLNIDMVLDLYRAIGYPVQVNKTVFQPVGAPHTWTACLLMMEWLAELANFHFEIKSQLEECPVQEDFNTLLINSFLNNQLDAPKKYLDSQIHRKQKQIQEGQYFIKTNMLVIQNIKRTQKDLSEMQQQQKKQLQILDRQRNELIQANYEKAQLLKKASILDQQFEKLNRQNADQQRQKSKLVNQIKNQQLSVEQVQQIKHATRQVKDKLQNLILHHQEELSNIHRNNENILNQYLQFNTTMNILNRFIQADKDELNRRSIYFTTQQCKLDELREFLDNLNRDDMFSKLQRILKRKQVKEIQSLQEQILQILRSEQTGVQIQKQSILNENKVIIAGNFDQQLKLQTEQRSYKQHRSGLQRKGINLQTIQSEQKRLQSTLQMIEQSINKKLQELDDNITQGQRLGKQCRQVAQFKVIFEAQVKNAELFFGKKFEEKQQKILQSLEETYQAYCEINDQISYFTAINQKK